MRRKKSDVEIVREEPASWLATFGDLATLLFTFYCLIYASSTYQPGQWEVIQGAMARALSVLPGSTSNGLVGSPGEGTLPKGTSIVPLLTTGRGLSPAAAQVVQNNAHHIRSMAARNGKEDSVEIEPLPSGFVFRLTSPVGFVSGSSHLTEEGRPLLETLAKMIRVGNAEVVVEGHTDDIPIHNERFDSNWELSGARAAEVVRFLREAGTGQAALYAKACGEYYPRVANVDRTSREKNRRVEIHVSYLQPPPDSAVPPAVLPDAKPQGG